MRGPSASASIQNVHRCEPLFVAFCSLRRRETPRSLGLVRASLVVGRTRVGRWSRRCGRCRRRRLVRTGMRLRRGSSGWLPAGQLSITCKEAATALASPNPDGIVTGYSVGVGSGLGVASTSSSVLASSSTEGSSSGIGVSSVSRSSTSSFGSSVVVPPSSRR